MPKKLTTEEFVARARAVHGERYGYEQVVYAGSHGKVKITCAVHGVFEQSPNSHLLGKNCFKCSRTTTTCEFIRKCALIHKSQYDYSRTVYLASKLAVLIGCPVHGFFQQEPRHHLAGYGCPSCGIKRRGRSMDTDAFVSKAQSKHGDMYDYSLVDYKGVGRQVTIVCKQHGVFKQTPHKHLSMERGCQKCASEAATAKQMATGLLGGWSRTDWIKTQNDRIAILYVIQVFDEGESFFKIGITYDFKNRFTKHSMPYSFRTVALYKSYNAGRVYDLEHQLHSRLKLYRHTPLRLFSGKTECFTEIAPILASLPPDTFFLKWAKESLQLTPPRMVA